MSTPDILGTVARLGLDVLSMLLLVGWLYRRRLAAPEMTLVFTALNIGLFAAVTAIGSGHFPTGIGFGLFGLLSLVRLRSAAFTLKDVAYTFVALVLALVNGLPDRNLALVVLLDVLLLVVAVGGRRDPDADPGDPADAGHPGHRRHRPEAAAAEVRRRVWVEPLSVVVEDVDLVRETTRVAVRYAVPRTPGRCADGQPADELDDDAERGGPRCSLTRARSTCPARAARVARRGARGGAAADPRRPQVPGRPGHRRGVPRPAARRAPGADDRRPAVHDGYRSTYFDTADLAACRAHIQQRRRRWKARSRLYVEDGLCRIEVKAKDGRGVTTKTVADADVAGYGLLGADEAAFVAAALARPRHGRRRHRRCARPWRWPTAAPRSPTPPRSAAGSPSTGRCGPRSTAARVARRGLRAGRDQGRPPSRPGRPGARPASAPARAPSASTSPPPRWCATTSPTTTYAACTAASCTPPAPCRPSRRCPHRESPAVTSPWWSSPCRRPRRHPRAGGPGRAGQPVGEGPDRRGPAAHPVRRRRRRARRAAGRPPRPPARTR